MRVEISLGLLFPCALKGLPSGRQVRLDSTPHHYSSGSSGASPADWPPAKLVNITVTSWIMRSCQTGEQSVNCEL